MRDATAIREQLVSVLADLQRIPRPSQVETIREFVTVLKLETLVGNYLRSRYGSADLADLDDEQLYEVLLHIRTLADLAEGAKARTTRRR